MTINNKTLSEENSKNDVLANTYKLLSMTLMFSAFTGYISVYMGIGHINPLISIPVSLGLLFLIEKFKNSSYGILLTFVFTGFDGIIIGPTLNSLVSNGMGDAVITSLIGTAVIFFSLSAYILHTKKDMSFMIGGLVTLAVISLALIITSIFITSTLLNLVVSGAVMLMSVGFILYTTSEIVNNKDVNYIDATIELYLSIYNMFLSLILMQSSLDD